MSEPPEPEGGWLYRLGPLERQRFMQLMSEFMTLHQQISQAGAMAGFEQDMASGNDPATVISYFRSMTGIQRTIAERQARCIAITEEITALLVNMFGEAEPEG